MTARSNKLTFADIQPFLTNAKRRNGGQIEAGCPVCGDDHHLYIKEENGKLLCYCQKCNAKGPEIFKAFRRMGAKPAQQPEPEPLKIVENYSHVYKNPDGSVAYYKQRIKYNNGKKKFTFYWINTETGEKIYSKPEGCNNLYNLNLLETALREHTTDTVYIVEGEKCADAMVKNGLLATTANTGAQKNIKLSAIDKQILNAFATRIVIPDNDDKGMDYATAFADVKILPMTEFWADCPAKGDVADYFAAGLPTEAIINYNFPEPINFDRDYFEKLDRWQMIDNSLFEAIFAIKEPAERERIVAMASIRATALSISRDFNRCWKAFLSAQAAKGIKSDNMTKFPGQLFALRCGEWSADAEGVKKNMAQSNGNFRWEFASPIPIMPVEVLVNVEDNTERLRIAIYKEGAWRSIVVPRSQVASNSKIIELADMGLEVNSDNSKLLVKYLADVVALNPDILPRVKAIGHLGWAEKEFIPYADDIKLDYEEQYKSLVASISSKGTLEEWTEFVRPLRKNIYLRLILAASFASPMIAKVGALPFVLHLWGGTGSGKTVGAMVAASIWGNPRFGAMVRTMNMTINSMMATAALLKNIPFFGDELQTIKSRYENYDTLIMRVCEGVDRGRMTNTTLQKQSTWQNAFIFTGEEPCTQSSSGGGVKNRVIEIECDHVVVEDGNGVVNYINSHYGCAGREFIEQVKSRPDLAKEYQSIFKTLLELSKSTEKQAMAMALMLLADTVATRHIFKDNDVLDFEAVLPFLKSVAEIDTAERAFAIITDIIAENSDKFEHEQTYDKASNLATWGKLNSDGSILINKTVLERELGKVGFDFVAVKKKWAAKGYLVLNSQGRYHFQTTVCGIKGNFVQLKSKM